MIKPSSKLHIISFGLTRSIISVVILAFSFFSMAAQASTIVQVKPQTISIAYGEKIQFSIEILNASNTYGFELHIAYDPTKVHVVDGDPGVDGVQLLHGDMYEVDQGFLVINEADNETGKATYAFTLLAPDPPLAGDGTLVFIEVEAVGGGRSTIDLEEVILASPDGEALPFVANDGEIIVEGAPEAPSTLPAMIAEPSAIDIQEFITPSSTMPIKGDAPASQFSQFALFVIIILMILIILGALFLILRWALRHR